VIIKLKEQEAMELLKIEYALCNAVKQQRDFYQCAGSIGGIVGKISNQEERNELIKDLKEFFDTYSPSSV